MSISPRARRAIAVGALALLIAGVITSAVRAIRDDREAVAGAGPVASVRQFLADTVIDNDGFQGCRYLTPAEQQRVARRADSPHSCGEALDWARLHLGGESYRSIRQIYDGLSASAVRRGRDAVVDIRHGRQSRSFILVPATPAQRNDFDAPPMPWRIDRGVAQLVPRLRP